jgi:hypothetical protein
MSIHLLCNIHDNKCIGTHDVIRDTFIPIAWDASFHMDCEQLQVFPSIIFNSFHQ